MDLLFGKSAMGAIGQLADGPALWFAFAANVTAHRAGSGAMW